MAEHDQESTGIRNTVIACLVIISLVLAALGYQFSRPSVLSDEALRAQGTFVLPRPREISELNLVDQAGEPFALQKFAGTWSLFYFGFTSCPDICPVTLSVLAEVERQLAVEDEAGLAEFQVIFVSVDPERDTVDIVKQYVRNFSERFTGVTGSLAEIAKLARQLNVAFGKIPDLNSPAGYQVEHSGNIVLVNPRGHYHGFIKMPHSAQQIKDSYRTLRANF